MDQNSKMYLLNFIVKIGSEGANQGAFGNKSQWCSVSPIDQKCIDFLHSGWSSQQTFKFYICL